MQQLGCGEFTSMCISHLPSCLQLSFAAASTDLGVRKGKGTAPLGSGCVEQKTWAGYPLSDFEEGPVPPQRVGGLRYSGSPLIKWGRRSHLFLSCSPSPLQTHPFFTPVKYHQLCIYSKTLKCGFLWWSVGCPDDASEKPKANPCPLNSGLYLEDSVDPVFLKCCKHVYVVIFSFYRL